MLSSLALLTKRLGHMSLSPYHQPQNAAALVFQGFVTSPASSALTQLRSFGSKKGSGNAGKKKKKKQAQLQRKTKSKPIENLQHGEWLKFQQSIAVEGFQTGQTTKLQMGLGKKRRGGQAVRKRLAKKEGTEYSANEPWMNQIGGRKNSLDGQYPPLRYSQEDTDRLLAEAYGAIPERAGKRGTRNLQRQSNRWHAVRKARKISKRNYGIRSHVRRMEVRSMVVRDVKQVKKDAPAIRQLDAMYQRHVLNRWAEIMLLPPSSGQTNTMENDQV